MSVSIYHNPRCSKSRQTLQLLKDRDIEPVIIEYLKAPLSLAEITQLIEQLGVEPRQMMRTKEAVYAELGLAEANDATLMQAMVEHPILIERPIVVSAGQARIGRPPENVLDIL